ncbi:MAG: glycosyltransferase [Rhodospirillaceae bacterium]|nr:glycosyltransferase [Rhodospirillaceae bacterium]
MKIAHIMSAEAFGGTGLQFDRLVAGLHGAGINQRVILADGSGRFADLKALGIETISMDIPGRFAFLDRRKINAELKRYTPDIVVSWSAELCGLVERGSYCHLGRAAAVFEPAAYATCNALFAPSQARADAAIAAGWAREAVHVLPHLPSAGLVRATVKPADRKTYFTPATARLLFTAARLIDSKGIDDLLQAIANISSVYLWIAGDGDDRQAFEARAHQLGIKPRVRFLGWQNDLRPYLAAADIFVYPARQEDLGDAVIEAWAAGVPLIAADSLGPGLLIRHQENGLLVPTGDPRSLSEAIRWMLVETAAAKRLAAAGSAAFDDVFATDKLLPRYIAMLKGLAGAPASTPTPQA